MFKKIFSKMKSSTWGTFYQDEYSGPGFPRETTLTNEKHEQLLSLFPGDFVCEATELFLDYRFGVVVESDMVEEDVYDGSLKNTSTRVTWHFTVMWA